MTELPLHPGVTILKHDESGLMAINKPEGIMSHPNKPGASKYAMINLPYDLEQECYYEETEEGNVPVLWLLNRLDSPTSGIVLATDNFEIVEHIRNAFRNREVHKTYYAIVKGFQMPAIKGTWQKAITVEKNGKFARGKGGKEGKKAVTHYRWIRSAKKPIDMSLIELKPETGVTHQLRIHCAMYKRPIIGDKTYGDFGWNRDVKKKIGFNRLALHAAEISLPLPDGRTFEAKAPIPHDFYLILPR